MAATIELRGTDEAFFGRAQSFVNPGAGGVLLHPGAFRFTVIAAFVNESRVTVPLGTSVRRGDYFVVHNYWSSTFDVVVQDALSTELARLSGGDTAYVYLANDTQPFGDNVWEVTTP